MRRFLKNVLLIFVFAGAYYVLEYFFSVDTPTKHVHISASHPFLVFISIIINPLIGGFAIALGNFALQVRSGSVIDWVLIVCYFLNCVSIGFGMRKYDLRNEYFGRTQIVRFNVIQIISNILCLGMLYPLITHLVQHNDYLAVLEKGLWQSFGNVLVCLLATTLFLMLYARSQFTEANFYRS